MPSHRVQPKRDFGHCLSLIIIILRRFHLRRNIQFSLLIAVIVYTAIQRRTLLSRHGGRESQSRASRSILNHQSQYICSRHKQQSYNLAFSGKKSTKCDDDYCFVVVVTVNMGFYDFFINWHRHYERVVLQSQSRQGRHERDVDSTQTSNRTVGSSRLPVLVVIAEDKEVYDKLLSLPLSIEDGNIAVILSAHETRQYDEKEAADYDSPNYKSLVSKRASHLLSLVCGLEEQDQSIKNASSLDDWNRWIVVYSDIDTVWLKNPLSVIESSLFQVDNTSVVHGPRSRQLQPKYDILASVDDRNYANFETYYCTGFLVMACTSSSIVFLSRWDNELRLNPQLNQPIFNSLLQTQHLDYAPPRYGSLSEVEFPPGRLFFDADRNQTEALTQTVVVHNNYIIGHDSKKKRFEQYGLWMP